MEVKLNTSNIEVENYLSKIGIANINKKRLNTFCHLVFVDKAIRIYHFKEVMQLIETMYRDEFLDLYVSKFNGFLEEGEEQTQFKFRPRSNYVFDYLDTYSFVGEKRGLYISDFRSFIEDVFTDINMDRDRGVQTNCFKEIENHIFDYLDSIERDGGNIFYKVDLIEYVNSNYETVAPMKFDDEINKRRYLKMTEEAGLIDVVKEYDRDVPEFKLSFQNEQTLEWKEDHNSRFLNLNSDVIEEWEDAYRGNYYRLAYHYDDVAEDKIHIKRYISTPKKFLVKSVK